MGAIKLTFDGANVTAKHDADIYSHLFSNKIGILYGVKNSCDYSLSYDKITFQDGYVCIYGRLIYIEDSTSVTIIPDSTKCGYVILRINTSSNTATVTTKESSSSYPSLTQTNLSKGNGTYEFPLCAYVTTATSVSINPEFQRQFIYTTQSLINEAKADVKNDLSYLKLRYKTPQTGSTYNYDISQYDHYEIFFIVSINYTCMVVFAGAGLSSAGSVAGMQYRYGGADYTMQISVSSSGNLRIVTAKDEHKVRGLFVSR